MSIDTTARGLSLAAQNVASIGYAGQYLHNFNAVNLYRFRAALTRQDQGGGYVKIACVGDSTTAGASSDASTGNYRVKSWPSQLATLLTNAGHTASACNAFGANAGSQSSGNVPGYWDSRMAGTGSWATIAVSPYASAGGGMFRNLSAATGTLTFTPGVNIDSCDIWYYDQTAGASFTISVDGGSTLATVTGAGDNLNKKVTVTFTAGSSHYITATWVSGVNNVIGFDGYLSTTSANTIRIWNFGQGGAQSSMFAVSGYHWSTDITKAMTPDLSFLCCGINDWIYSDPVPSYTANCQTFITAMQSVGSDVVLITPFPTSSLGIAVAVQAQYVAAMNALALSNNIPVIDENFNLVSKAQMITIGLGSDANHPNYLGHGIIARDVFKALMYVM